MEQLLAGLFIIGFGYLVYRLVIKPRLDKRKSGTGGGRNDPADSHEN